MKRLLAILLLLPALAFGQAKSVSILSFGADNTGATDVSTALNNAVTWVAGGQVVVPPGKYLLNGTATIALANVEIECQGSPAGSNYGPGGTYGTNGAVFLLTSTSVQPFTVGNAVRITDCNFFWPNQTQCAIAPTAYPPLFTEPLGSNMSNFDLVRDRIIDAYDVIDQASLANSDAIGNISMTDTYGYAIRYWFSVGNVPETVTVKGMSADWNLYQNVANAGNQCLTKWTAANGAFLHVYGNGNGTTTTSSVNIAGFTFDGAVFATNKFLWVDSTGSLTESHATGILDTVPHVIQVDTGGCFASIYLNMVYVNISQFANGGTDNGTAFALNSPASSGCTETNIDIGGSFNTAQGDVIDVNGNPVKAINLHLGGFGTYANTSTAGTYYFANINAPNAQFTAIGNHVEPANPSTSKHGFNIQACSQCVIAGSSFLGVHNPIILGSSTVPVVGTGNISGGSIPTGSSAIVGTGYYAHQLLNGNTWADVPLPTCSSCGSGPSCSVASGISSDIAGQINVGGGSVTACTLNFANAWTNYPKCMFNSGNGPTWFSGGSLTSAITINNASSMGGGFIEYTCQP